MRLWYLLAHRLWVRSFLFCSLVSLPLRLPQHPPSWGLPGQPGSPHLGAEPGGSSLAITLCP